MDPERTVVMTERKPRADETEQQASRLPDTHPRARLLANRADEGDEVGLASPLTCSGLEGSEAPPRRLEDTARAALELRSGRPFSDVEWVQARAGLLEFVTILRTWNGQAKTPESGLGNVV
jgi:hypothetical protein